MAPPLLQQKYAFLLQMCGERGERRSALREKHSSLLSTAMRQHSSCDVRTASKHIMHALLALVIVYRQLVTLRLHSSGFTLFVSSCSLGSPLETASRPSATPTVCSRTNSRGLRFRGCRWRGQQPRRPTLGVGVKDTVTSRAVIHSFNALFVR